MTNLWNKNNLTNPHQLSDKHLRVQEMFSRLARSYDLANHLLSLNMDRRWRRRAVELAQMEPGQSVLDLCCGTGDLAFEFARHYPYPAHIVGIDFSSAMLERAQQKQRKFIDAKHNQYNYRNIKWLCADAQQVPLDDGQFDCISCAFGFRNLQNLPAGLQQAYRLLKPGGRLVVLEFTIPDNPLVAWLYQCYFRLVLPIAGSIITNDRNGAYHYLSCSVSSFRTAEVLSEKITQVGFSNLRMEKLFFGAVLAFVAHK